MLGYPASAITILTTYRGQKHLIRDVIEKRCARLPAYGRPAAISTVDKYQVHHPPHRSPVLDGALGAVLVVALPL
jgi:hypothetical protein